MVAGTLVAQGLTLRPLILLLGLKDDDMIGKEVRGAQAEVARVAAGLIGTDDSDAAQRQTLVRMRSRAEIGDDAFHRIEEQLDRSEINVR